MMNVCSRLLLFTRRLHHPRSTGPHIGIELLNKIIVYINYFNYLHLFKAIWFLTSNNTLFYSLFFSTTLYKF